jgi:hypothetical protein
LDSVRGLKEEAVLMGVKGAIASGTNAKIPSTKVRVEKTVVMIFSATWVSNRTSATKNDNQMLFVSCVCEWKRKRKEEEEEGNKRG